MTGLAQSPLAVRAGLGSRASTRRKFAVGVAKAPPDPARKPNGAIVGPGWRPTEGLDLPAWIDQGRRLGRHARWSKWWVGDWLIFGNSRWGEKYTRASNILGYDVKTLANMVYVARRFKISRRREVLSWSHHEAVAGLSVEEQEAWLDHASIERLSVRDLRHEIKSRGLARRRFGAGTAAAANGVLENGARQTDPAMFAAAVLTSHVVRDLNTSIGFYEALGLEVMCRDVNDRGGHEAFLGVPGDGPRLELVESSAAQTAAAPHARDGAHTTVWVRDIVRVRKHLAKHDTTHRAAGSRGDACFVRDPDGYVVKLVDASTWAAVVDRPEPSQPSQRHDDLAAVAG